MVLLLVDVKRIGNWYSLVVNETTYNVLIQSNFDVSSVIVFDEDFKIVENHDLLKDVETIMSKMDWKYDTLNT